MATAISRAVSRNRSVRVRVATGIMICANTIVAVEIR